MERSEGLLGVSNGLLGLLGLVSKHFAMVLEPWSAADYTLVPSLTRHAGSATVATTAAMSLNSCDYCCDYFEQLRLLLLLRRLYDDYSDDYTTTTSTTS